MTSPFTLRYRDPASGARDRAHHAQVTSPLRPGAAHPLTVSLMKLPRRVKLLLIFVGMAIVAGAFARVVRGAGSDFPLHYEFGRRFASGEFIYRDGLHVPYPPFWAMFWAPWTRLPLRAAQWTAFGVFGLGGLIGLSAIVLRIGRSALPASDDRHAIALAVAIALTSRFILRDLTESGPNLFVWSLVWGGIVLYLERKRMAGGLLIGAATALKMTPAIFVPYFVLKREWRTAAVAVATAALLTALPGLWQSRGVFSQEMHAWGMNAWTGLVALDPSATILEEPPVANLSLRPALARFLQRYPAGHPLFLDHPGFLQFLDLPPRLAGWVVRVVAAGFLFLVGWQFRTRASEARHPMLLPIELAAVSALSLLYSPITWKQHCVGLLPASFFLASCALQWDRVTRWMWAAVSYYVAFAVLLSRDLTGRTWAVLLESYHVVTWAILLVAILVLAWHRRILLRGPSEEGGRSA